MRHNTLAESLATAMAPTARQDLDADVNRRALHQAQLEHLRRLIDEDRLAGLLIVERDAPGSAAVTVTPYGALGTVLEACARLLRAHAPAAKPG